MPKKKLTDEELAKIIGGKCCADAYCLTFTDASGGGGGGGNYDDVDADAPGSVPSDFQRT